MTEIVPNDFERNDINLQLMKSNTNIVEIDGKKYLTDDDGEPVNVSHYMSETEFLNDWLLGFAIGYVYDKTFFDFNRWGEFTEQGKWEVAVTDDNDPKKILFIVPSLLSMNLDDQTATGLTVASKHMSQAKSAVDRVGVASNFLNQGKLFIAEIMKDRERTLTDLVPSWFYEKWKVRPTVVQQMIFCRERYGITADKDPEIWRVAEQCFTQIDQGYELNTTQKEFINELTQGEFSLPENLKPYTDIPKEGNGKTLDAEYDPLEC